MTTWWTDSEQKRLEAVLLAAQEFLTKGHIESPEAIQKQIEKTLQMPLSNPVTSEVMVHPFVLMEYANFLVEHFRFLGRNEKHLSILTDLWQHLKDESAHVRVRTFRPQGGSYYGLPFDTPDALYTFWDDEPVLVTRLSKEWLEEPFMQTELGWLTRPEVRLLSALMFSTPTTHGPAFYFQPLDQPYDLPGSLVLHESEHLNEHAMERARTAARILTRLRTMDLWDSRTVAKEISAYRFRSDEIDVARTTDFYTNFDIEDNLTLRTSFLLFKSATLWGHDSRAFGEDAAANLFFGLEGCLRLLHRKHFGNSNFEIKVTLEHLEAVFPHRPGYTWMLEDAYQKRIQIAHPEPKNLLGWLPNIYADDFYENFSMATDLLYYAVTGAVLPVNG